MAGPAVVNEGLMQYSFQANILNELDKKDDCFQFMFIWKRIIIILQMQVL